MLVHARNGAAIGAALERFLEDPSLLGVMSQACLAEARSRSVEAFNADLAALARETLASCL